MTGTPEILIAGNGDAEILLSPEQGVKVCEDRCHTTIEMSLDLGFTSLRRKLVSLSVGSLVSKG
jgi:hypothetical protein